MYRIVIDMFVTLTSKVEIFCLTSFTRSPPPEAERSPPPPTSGGREALQESAAYPLVAVAHVRANTVTNVLCSMIAQDSYVAVTNTAGS